MATVDTVVADAADRAANGLVVLSQASERLVERVSGLDPASYDRVHLDALRAAVCFDLTPDGTFRGSFAGSGPVPWPRSLPEISPDVLALWAAYAESIRDAAMRAHLHDLLQQAGAQPVHAHARAAISAYQEAVPAFLDTGEQSRGQLRAVRSLTRALTLAARMNQQDLRQLVATDVLHLAGSLLADEPVAFGLVLELLEVLHDHRLEPGLAGDLIERAIDRCTVAFLRLRFLSLLRAMGSDDAERKATDQRIVNSMLTEAGRTTGALRLAWLNDAATRARDAGLADLHQATIQTMQSIPVAELGLVPTGRLVMQLTSQELDASHAVVDVAADLGDALWRVAGTQPPAGTRAAAEEQARQLIPGVPLVASIARGALNPAGPVPVAPASDDAAGNIAAECQVVVLQRSGLAIAAQLDRICERFRPSESDLAAVFAHDACGSPSQLRMLVRAFQFYWAGLDDAAVHLALPRVEALLREIERSRGVPVLAVARGTTPAGMTQLGALIKAMPDAGFDSDWQRSLALLLTDGQLGLNLRNGLSHGLSDCPPRHLVALVLHAALFLLAAAHGIISLSPPRPPAPTSPAGPPEAG